MSILRVGAAPSAGGMQAAVLRWMRSELRDDLGDNDGYYVDQATGEANLTRLAEAAAEAHDHDEWLDDPDHWVWDMAIEAAEAEGCGVRA